MGEQVIVSDRVGRIVSATRRVAAAVERVEPAEQDWVRAVTVSLEAGHMVEAARAAEEQKRNDEPVDWVTGVKAEQAVFDAERAQQDARRVAEEAKGAADAAEGEMAAAVDELVAVVGEKNHGDTETRKG